MKGVGAKGIQRINKTFLKQLIKARMLLTIVESYSDYSDAKEEAYVMKYGVYAFL